jgi:hypothetical protein
VRRHASADEMASYAAGDMRPRKAAKIRAHLDECPDCRQLSQEHEGVSSLLASVSFAPMPETLSARVESAIATEVAQRVTSGPVSEAGRRDLPARSRRSRQVSWRPPSISSGALRTVAASAAVVVVVGGVYELVSHAPGSSPSGASAPAALGRQSAGLGAPAQAHGQATPSFGPDVTLTAHHHEISLRTASTGTDFVPAHMQTQVSSAMTQATDDGLIASNNRALNLPTSSAARDFSLPSEYGTAQRLGGCIERVAGLRIPELVELARFEGKAATIIVLAAVASHPAEVLVVGASCSAAASDLLDHQLLKHV